MKSGRMKWLAAGLALVLLVAVGVAQTIQRVHMDEDGMFGGHLLDRMTQDLGLTDAQQTQIKGLMDQQKATVKPLFQQLALGHQQMMQLIQSNNFDEAKARQIATQQAQVRIEMDVAMARTGSQIFQVLTPDQKTKAVELMKQHEQRFNKHMQGQSPSNDAPSSDAPPSE